MRPDPPPLLNNIIIHLYCNDVWTSQNDHNTELDDLFINILHKLKLNSQVFQKMHFIGHDAYIDKISMPLKRHFHW